MECKKYSELISAYVDGMLAPHEEEKLMAHLMVCENCNEEMRALKQLKFLLEQMEEPELPNGFHEELMTHIKQEEKQQTIHTFKWKWQYSGALVATLIVGILGMQNQPSSEPIALAKAAPYRVQESAISEEIDKEQTQEVQVASENQKVLGRSRMISEGVEDTLQEVRWKLDIKEKPDFLEQLKNYLESIGITYEANQKEVLCYQAANHEGLMDWIKEQGVKCEGEVTETAINLVIELEE